MNDLNQKISDLFDYRKLPWLGELLRIHTLPAFLNSLMKLQLSIFLYDSELEKSWNPSNEILAKYWKGMEIELNLLGVRNELLADYLFQIRVYADNELSMRHGKKLSDLPIFKFYYYKSCDVRLMRRLLYKAGSQDDVVSYSDWLLFDMITEINDDILDVEEDLSTFNGNRFIWSIREKGWESTLNDYGSAIDAVENAIEDKLHNCSRIHVSEILNDALNEARRTRDKMNVLVDERDCIKIDQRLVMNEGII